MNAEGVASVTNRIASLEEIIRQQEQTLTILLGRLRDMEQFMGNESRNREQAQYQLNELLSDRSGAVQLADKLSVLIGNQNERISALQAESQGNRAALQGLDQKMDTAFRGVEQKLSGDIVACYERIKAGEVSSQEALHSLQSTLQTQAQTIQSVDGQCRSSVQSLQQLLNADITAVRQRTDVLETSTRDALRDVHGSLSSDIKETQSNLETALQAAVQLASSNLEYVDSRVRSEMVSMQQRHQGQIDSLRQKMDDSSAALQGSILTSHNTLAGEVAAVAQHSQGVDAHQKAAHQNILLELSKHDQQMEGIDVSWRGSVLDLNNKMQEEITTAREMFCATAHSLQAQIVSSQENLSAAVDKVNANVNDLARSVQERCVNPLDAVRIETHKHAERIGVLSTETADIREYMRNFASEVDRNATQFRTIMEAAVRASHSDLLDRINVVSTATALRQDPQQVYDQINTALLKLWNDVSGTYVTRRELHGIQSQLASLEDAVRIEVCTLAEKDLEIHRRLDTVEVGQRKIETPNVVNTARPSYGNYPIEKTLNSAGVGDQRTVQENSFPEGDSRYRFDKNGNRFDPNCTKYAENDNRQNANRMPRIQDGPVYNRSHRYDNEGVQQDEKARRCDDGGYRYDQKGNSVDASGSRYDHGGLQDDADDNRSEVVRFRSDGKGSRYDVQGTRYDEYGFRHDANGNRFDVKGNRYDDREDHRYDDKGARHTTNGPLYDQKDYQFDHMGNRNNIKENNAEVPSPTALEETRATESGAHDPPVAPLNESQFSQPTADNTTQSRHMPLITNRVPPSQNPLTSVPLGHVEPTRGIGAPANLPTHFVNAAVGGGESQDQRTELLPAQDFVHKTEYSNFKSLVKKEVDGLWVEVLSLKRKKTLGREEVLRMLSENKSQVLQVILDVVQQQENELLGMLGGIKLQVAEFARNPSLLTEIQIFPVENGAIRFDKLVPHYCQQEPAELPRTERCIGQSSPNSPSYTPQSAAYPRRTPHEQYPPLLRCESFTEVPEHHPPLNSHPSSAPSRVTGQASHDSLYDPKERLVDANRHLPLSHELEKMDHRRNAQQSRKKLQKLPKGGGHHLLPLDDLFEGGAPARRYPSVRDTLSSTRSTDSDHLAPHTIHSGLNHHFSEKQHTSPIHRRMGQSPPRHRQHDEPEMQSPRGTPPRLGGAPQSFALNVLPSRKAILIGAFRCPDAAPVNVQGENSPTVL